MGDHVSRLVHALSFWQLATYEVVLRRSRHSSTARHLVDTTLFIDRRLTAIAAEWRGRTHAVQPIHYATLPCVGEVWSGPGWYFWQESWADRSGPYDSEAEARAHLGVYIGWLAQPPPTGRAHG